jgi:hypothetical protein
MSAKKKRNDPWNPKLPKAPPETLLADSPWVRTLVVVSGDYAYDQRVAAWCLRLAANRKLLWDGNPHYATFIVSGGGKIAEEFAREQIPRRAKDKLGYISIERVGERRAIERVLATNLAAFRELVLREAKEYVTQQRDSAERVLESNLLFGVPRLTIEEGSGANTSGPYAVPTIAEMAVAFCVLGYDEVILVTTRGRVREKRKMLRRLMSSRLARKVAIAAFPSPQRAA